MMKTSMLALALSLVAPAAFSQTSLTVAHAKAKVPALSLSAQGQIKILRAEIKREKGDLAAKRKAVKTERLALAGQKRAETDKVKTTTGTKAQKRQARAAVRQKYAELLKGLRDKRRSESRWMKGDIKSKQDMILKLRHS